MLKIGDVVRLGKENIRRGRITLNVDSQEVMEWFVQANIETLP